ncbi:MAG: hypothetical protein IGS03_02560 [Candidatus Sericytochromatia bacterium]|nr:hypothetical protein [Candidatus Sericytochromatia bacterium]
MSDDKKEPRKKTEAEKKAEQDAMVHLWMNGMGSESSIQTEAETQDQSKD